MPGDRRPRLGSLGSSLVGAAPPPRRRRVPGWSTGQTAVHLRSEVSCEDHHQAAVRSFILTVTTRMEGTGAASPLPSRLPSRGGSSVWSLCNHCPTHRTSSVLLMPDEVLPPRPVSLRLHVPCPSSVCGWSPPWGGLPGLPLLCWMRSVFTFVCSSALLWDFAGRAMWAPC